jgi:predicted Zn-dependent protease with MMP-like domain
MNIPKRFKLFGATIDIDFSDTVFTDHGSFGTAVLTGNKIVLQAQNEAHRYSQEQVEQTLWHEVVHHVLNKMGQERLCNSEKFVDLFSALIHQAITTMEYEDDVKPVGKKSR